jgi:hypothetical protein
MISLSILGMTGWVNPLRVAVRRPWTLSVARRRSAGAFFVGTPALVRHPFWLIIQRKLLSLDGPRGGCSPPEGRLAGGCTPPAFSRFLLLGKKGTAFFEETSTYHKVEVCQSRRLILAIHYVLQRKAPPARPVLLEYSAIEASSHANALYRQNGTGVAPHSAGSTPAGA